tara:strand:+ start:3587 stop:4567 length:981 start_codon:yes stop_codon:yes gene_type:complete
MLAFENGICIGNLSIDPSRKRSIADNVLISHAHSDHVKLNKTSRYFFSPQTKKLVESRYEKVENSKGIPFGKKVKIADLPISLYNSGHILGSSMVEINAGEKILYTGDFKTQDSLIQKGAKPRNCDVLIVESTFGLPSFSFPERTGVYEAMGSWIKEKSKTGFVVLAGYSLGKAQELTAICNKYANISPIVHDRVFDNNEVYRNLGVKLGPYHRLNHNLKESSVLIMPPTLVDHNLQQVLEYSLKKKVYSAFATGWSFRSAYNQIFPLSDHSDFPQLLEYVKACDPKIVFTVHGYEREFASYITRRLGIPAKPLAQKGQKVLSEFF